ncbi:carboxypeptidase-like regulatory domain-containing protein [Algoriphagus litoralis]|uniref:carboxypeptidase-like regulatory domain-containing protein n=1 Tax=Algoriphagus litoralis TaxID=2202829 RepID=UPI000DBAC423|nr:carboxypeptidase-like regulatory domain-containing protein [Algoriphagus litoralis]
MNRKLLFLFFFFSASYCQAQFRVKGKIIDQFDKQGVPGAKILEHGTENGTIADLDGNFQLSVSHPNAILEVSFVGYSIKKVSIKSEDFLTITLKSDCNRDFFDAQSIGVYALSGVLNNPIGGQIDFAFPTFSKGTLTAGFSLQSDLRDNNFFTAKAEYKHFIFNCDFDLDLNFYHGRINYTEFRSVISSLETNFNYGNLRLIGGYSRMNFDERNSMAGQTFSAPVVGIGTWINTPKIRTLVTGKVALFKNRPEINTRATFITKYADLFLNYYDLGTFSEFTIGIGKQFGYRLKSQKKNQVASVGKI